MSETVPRPVGTEEGSRAPASPPPAHAALAAPTELRLPEQPRMSMRKVLARLGGTKPVSAVQLEPLFAAMRQHHPRVDTGLIERAFRTAEHFHEGQLRKSGDPYITHPLAVATILGGLGLTEPTVCAAVGSYGGVCTASVPYGSYEPETPSSSS